MKRRRALPILVLTGVVAACSAGAAVVRTSGTTQAPAPVGFDAKVRPLLEAKCSPCRFQGGKMYATLPFDRPGTIRALGTKLFTRIKDEEERALIRAFLAGPPPAAEGQPGS